MRPFITSGSGITLFLALTAHVQATPLPRVNNLPILPRHVQAETSTTPYDSSTGSSIRSNDPSGPSMLLSRGVEHPADQSGYLITPPMQRLTALRTAAEKFLKEKQVVELNHALSEVRGFYPNPANQEDSVDDKHKQYPINVQDFAEKTYDTIVADFENRVKKGEIIRIQPDVQSSGFKFQLTTDASWHHNFRPHVIPTDTRIQIPPLSTAQSLVDFGEKCLQDPNEKDPNRNIVVRWQLIMLAGLIVRESDSGREGEFNDFMKKLELACEEAGLDKATRERLEKIHEHYAEIQAGINHPGGNK
ncbi:hypothetical protein H0H93_006511 [Arthromyces matolae]|nr:hypothetical protein H0H93_006511 [Arthromyces matolae]